MGVTPGVVVDGKLVTNDLVEINLGIRILLGSSFYDDWEDQEMFVTRDPLGNPVDRRHPWNQHTIPQPQKRDFDGKYSWVMSPRWFDGTDHLALDTGGGPLARLWSTALSGLVDTGHVKATGNSVRDQPAQDRAQARGHLRVEDPAVVEHHRARPGPHLLPGLRRRRALDFIEKALAEVRAGHTKTWEPFEVPDEGIGCGFTEAVRGVLSHHMVIRDGKIANYHPYPPTPWNANPRDSFGTPGPYEDAVHEHADLRGERPGPLQGHRHHAGGAQLRPVPALRGAHVPRARARCCKKLHSPTQVADPTLASDASHPCHRTSRTPRPIADTRTIPTWR